MCVWECGIGIAEIIGDDVTCEDLQLASWAGKYDITCDDLT